MWKGSSRRESGKEFLALSGQGFGKGAAELWERRSQVLGRRGGDFGKGDARFRERGGMVWEIGASPRETAWE